MHPTMPTGAIEEPPKRLDPFSPTSSRVSTEAEEKLVRTDGGLALAERSLRESEERYQMLLDAVRNYAIFMMDPRGQIVSWNAGAERIKGYKADQIIGRSFSCFFPPADVERGRPEDI